MRFSVVIPAYNREGTVGRAIESALAQSYAPFEVIVVDDGSKDGTAAVIEAFGPPVTLIRQPNGGAPVARNTGVRAAKGDWIAFLDSDDYWTPGHLERVAAAIEGTGGAAHYYFTNIDMAENEGGRPQWERAQFSIEGPYQMLADGTPWVLRPRIPMVLQAAVFHRERLLAEGGLWQDLPMRDDTHVFLRHGIARPICAVAGIGTIQTSDDQSGGRLTTTISNRTLRYWRCSVRMWKDLLDRIPAGDAASRRLVRQRLSTSYLRRGFLATREGARLAWIGGLAQSAWSHPPTFLRSVAKKLGIGPREDLTA
ncbi:MAG: glycosyltransferase family 2 protein [Planctomycetota bacterium]